MTTALETHEQVEDHLREYLDRMMPKEARSRYFQKRNGPMFLWTVESFNTRYGDPKVDGKYESVVYVPVGKGSRSGKATKFKRDESTATLHALRKDAKTRAWRLYNEWLAEQA